MVEISELDDNGNPIANNKDDSPRERASQKSFFPEWLHPIIRLVMLFMMTRFITTFVFKSGKKDDETKISDATQTLATGSFQNPNNARMTSTGLNTATLGNLWTQGATFSVHVFVSTRKKRNQHRVDSSYLLWEQHGITYDWDSDKSYASQNITFELPDDSFASPTQQLVIGKNTVDNDYSQKASPFLNKYIHKAVQANRTIYAHVYFTLDKYPPLFHSKLQKVMNKRRRKRMKKEMEKDTASDKEIATSTGTAHDDSHDGSSNNQVITYPNIFDERATMHARHKLTQYLQEKKKRKLKNLITGETDAKGESFRSNANEITDAQSSENSMGHPTGKEETTTRERKFELHFKPDLRMHLIPEFNVWKADTIPSQMRGKFRFFMPTGQYFPPIYISDFWITRAKYIKINQTSAPTKLNSVKSSLENESSSNEISDDASSDKDSSDDNTSSDNKSSENQNQNQNQKITLSLSISPLSMWKWQMQQQMEASWELQRSMGTLGDGDSDLIRDILQDTNVYLLGVTMAVSLLHTVFDFLAFKNDVAFWRNMKSMKGLSLNKLLLNLFFSVVIFLYLLDSENVSWMILCSNGVGLVIEFWKISKTLSIRVVSGSNLRAENETKPSVPEETNPSLPEETKSSLPDTSKTAVNIPVKKKLTNLMSFEIPLTGYSIAIDSEMGYVESATKYYDDLALTYLAWTLFPCSFGYAIYSVLYREHASVYSFIIRTLVGFIYIFGFILMTPQLFINYKLKSVAHMPWRAMVYKSLNTFIDDLFAFIIKMPMMHRISCFRDDLIFFIYLYQRYIYPVDSKRLNEYGVSQEDYQKVKDELIKED
eukprot:g3166.t1